MKLVTQDVIKKMNELYVELGTYAAVARATGFSPGTVKKYIQKDYVPEDQRTIVRYEGTHLPDWDFKVFRGKDLGEMCELSDEEVKEIRELWKELDV